MIAHRHLLPAGRFVNKRAHSARLVVRPSLIVRFEEEPSAEEDAEECPALIQPVSAKHRLAAQAGEASELIQHEFLEARRVHRG